MRVALVQMNSGSDKNDNIARAAKLIEKAVADERPDLILLPECFMFYGGSREQQIASAEPCPGGQAYTMLSEAAARHKVFIHAGSLNELDGDKTYNATIVFNREGKEVARYRKIHMFSITDPDGVAYDESWFYEPGSDIVTYDLDGTTIGCTICYDVRFPELFSALVERGVKIIAVPAAFTLATGKEHWEPLLRARAIETQCFILAPAMEGAYDEDGAKLFTYGHSMIIEPWGSIVARRALGDGVVASQLDLSDVDRARDRIQLANHRVKRKVKF